MRTNIYKGVSSAIRVLGMNYEICLIKHWPLACTQIKSKQTIRGVVTLVSQNNRRQLARLTPPYFRDDMN